MKILEGCTDMLGRPITDDLKKSIKAFIKAPTADNWDEIAHVIINPSALTIWQAVIRYVDPTFPQTGRVEDINGRVIKEWERIPTPYEVALAIKKAKKQKEG